MKESKQPRIQHESRPLPAWLIFNVGQRMKPFAIVLSLLFLVSCRERSIDGHADGAMPVGVTVVVHHGVGGHALEGVRVTFFSNRDQAVLRLRESMRAEDEKHIPPIPEGTSAKTDRRGTAKLACMFPAAFMFHESPANIVRSEWRPSGILQFEKPGFVTITQELRTVFPSPPYKGADAPSRVMIKMKPEPNKALEPTPTAVTPRAAGKKSE